jgi:hypothetical protein
MANSIGSVTFVMLNLVQGEGSEATVTEEISRPGTRGNAFRVLGARGGVVEYESLRDCTTAAGLKTTFESYRALMGTVRTLTDSHGNAYTVFVQDVQKTSEKRMSLVVGGNGGEWILRARWRVVVL